MALRYLLPGQMRFMAANGFDVLMISADGKEFAEVTEQEQCRHIIVPMTRKITPFQDTRCLLQLIRIFSKEKPDIVHTHTPKAGLLGMLAAKFCGVKIRIHTVAGLPLMVEKGFKYQLLKFIEKITYAAATQVWPNSNSLLKFISAKKLVNPAKLGIIGKGSTNGINVNRFSKAALDEKICTEIKGLVGYSAENKYLLCIGRLVVDKSIVELVNVFKQLMFLEFFFENIFLNKHSYSFVLVSLKIFILSFQYFNRSNHAILSYPREGPPQKTYSIP